MKVKAVVEIDFYDLDDYEKVYATIFRMPGGSISGYIAEDDEPYTPRTVYVAAYLTKIWQVEKA